MVTLECESLTGLALRKEDREFLLGGGSLLNDVDADKFDTLVKSLKSDTRKMGDWLRDHSGPVKGVVAGLLAKRGIELDPTLPWGPQMTKARNTPPIARLERLIGVCQNIGFDSVYVLIDRLDETATTNTDPKKAIELVLKLLLDLKVMELHGMAVKVFAWDLSEDHYHEMGGRRDRVKEHSLVWRLDSLAEMMTKRLSAYSGGTITSLDDLADKEVDFDLHRLAAYLAHGSPRDMIRLGGHLVAEHLDRADASGKLSAADIWAGVRRFGEEIADERAKRYMPDLLRLDSYRFTQNRVANDYLKISKQATGAKIGEWRKEVVPALVEIEVAVPRLTPALR